MDTQHAIAHSKVMIIDGETVITGSFNFTKAAEKNPENLFIIHEKNWLPSIQRIGRSMLNIRRFMWGESNSSENLGDYQTSK